MKPTRRRRSIRLKGYDYSQAGAYFVTICTQNRKILFGEIAAGEMQLNEFGRLVCDEWIKSARIRAEIKLDAYIVMPNHLHGIVRIDNPVGAYGHTPLRAYGHTPLQSKFVSPSKTIGAMIRGFKSTAKRRINELRQTPGMPVWQRNYYDHIIRNEDEFNRIREYIRNNPLSWQFDRENPEGIEGTVLFS